MKVLIKRFDTSLPLPEYQTVGAAAQDLVARVTTTIQPHTVGLIPLNIALKIPQGHWVLMAARSSLHKKGVMMANGIGVGDSDFCGDDDEYRAALLNFTNESVTIERGERIVQMMVLPIERVSFEEVTKLDSPNRGGMGSTGR
jgi:dUTP pyrophosphatase